MFRDQKQVETILSALGEHLEEIAREPLELVACGGSALQVLDLIRRATKDVDIVAYVRRDERGDPTFIKADPLSPELLLAARKVARDFNLPDDWLNPGPTSALDFGLPEGLLERVVTRQFGTKLIVHFLGRYDQICFKVYAATDQGPGKHLDDLLLLKPTADEIEQAARWSMSHDSSEGYRQSLRDLLEHIGFGDVAQRL